MEIKDLGIEPLRELPVRKSMGQHVFEHLKKAIIFGKISPGQRLVETRIANMLDISRTPVREAIHKLEEILGKKVKWNYDEKNRVGDHICYISDLRKLRKHYPEWTITRSLDDILLELVQFERARPKGCG